jgi:hypothetical protein
VNLTRDGGPAFPMERHLPNGNEANHGMSLRDYFAAHLAAAMIVGDMQWQSLSKEDMATYAYSHADALLKERAK